MRSIVHCLIEGLQGRSASLARMKPQRMTTGVGLSDWEGYAAPLGRVFAYINTFYHQEPRLDVCAPGQAYLGHCDFLISSDVFEHVPAPVARAFDGAFAMLRPGGLLVLTAPFSWNSDTIEHYPDLCNYSVVEIGGDHVVVVKDHQGKISLVTDPVFHGGPGSTLEMRLFSRDGLLSDLAAAGFVDIRVHEEAVPEWGIFPPHRFGVPITARKPITPLQRAKAQVRKARTRASQLKARLNGVPH